jgi:hypothetical protein
MLSLDIFRRFLMSARDEAFSRKSGSAIFIPARRNKLNKTDQAVK